MAARTIRDHLRQRRMQRWLRREAALLAREAALFDCDEMHREAENLVALTSSMPSLVILQTA